MAPIRLYLPHQDTTGKRESSVSSVTIRKICRTAPLGREHHRCGDRLRGRGATGAKPGRLAARLVGRHQRRGDLPAADQGPASGMTCPIDRAELSGHRLVGGLALPLLSGARRAEPAVPAMATRGRHAWPRSDVLIYTEDDARYELTLQRVAQRPVRHDHLGVPRHHRGAADPAGRSACRADPGRPRRRGVEYRVDHARSEDGTSGDGPFRLGGCTSSPMTGSPSSR